MEPEQANESIFYNSLYRHGVDDKRRVQIPAKWRPGKPEAFTLILWPKGSTVDACLLVLPPREWAGLAEKLKAMPFYDPKAQALRHLIGRKSDRVTIDRAGRICVPEAMARSAAIDGEAVLVGLVDRFEIWNPARYEASSAADEQLMSEAFQLI
jgi:MraZ protein